MEEPMELDGIESTSSLDTAIDGADSEGTRKLRYQKANVYIRILPYADLLEDETEELLDKTLLNLTKAVVGRDLNGFSLYTKSLAAYIDMYGRKFTKDQHIKLIQLMLEVLTTTSSMNVVHDATELIQTLLKKQELLTRYDLVIPWRPLYMTLDRWVYHRKYSLSLNANTKLEYCLRETVRLCSLYFPKESLQEIIDEFSPTLCPSSIKMSFGLDMLKYFLPFKNSECEEELREFIKFLLSFHDSWNNHPHWEWSMMKILSTAGWTMTGKLDWDPYLPIVYARLMRNLNLPVYFKSAQNNGSISNCKIYDCESTARWIVSTLGNNPLALHHLKTFMKSLETYYNPANAGRWTATLANLLRELASFFTLRVKRERYLEKKHWWSKTPADKKLTETDIDIFVDILSRVALDFYLDLPLGGFVLKYLAVLRPTVIIPAVMEKYSLMVETVTESKKYMTTMRWVLTIIPILASSEKDGYDGRSLILPFMQSLLPAIDPNDMIKTLTSLTSLCIIFSNISIVDCSSLAYSIDDEEVKELCLCTGTFDDFVTQLLERVFTLIENRAHENTRMSDSRMIHNVNMEDVSLQKIIWAVFRPLAMHSSTAICKLAVEKICSFALSNTLETEISGRLFGSICQAYAVSRPDIILPRLLPQLCHSVVQHITDDILDDEELDKTLQFHMLLLNYLMETIGTDLLKFKEPVESMLTAVLKLNGKKGYVSACSVLMRLLNSLVSIYPLENKLVDCDYDNPNYVAVEDWGKPCHWRDTRVNWHSPNAEELDWAKDIFLRKFVEFKSLFEGISSFTEGNEKLNKSLLKGLQVLLSLYDGLCVLLPFWNDTPIVAFSKESVVDFSADVYRFGLPAFEISVPGTGENIKYKYFQIYTELQTYLEKFKPDDTEAFVALIRGLDSLIVPTISSGNRYVVSPKVKNLPVSVPSEDTPAGLNKKRYLRFKSVVRAYSIHMKRIRASGCTSWTTSHLEVMERLFSLCVNRYAKVRSSAQQRFCRYIDWSGGFLNRFISKLVIEKLQDSVPHHEYKGTLYTLQSSKCSPVLINSWEELYKLWMALVKSPFSEKNSIILCMQNLQSILARDFVFFPFEDETPENSRVDHLAKMLLKESQWNENIDGGKLKPLDLSKNIKYYNLLIDSLLEFGPDSKSHWRKQLLCSDMLSVLMVQEVPMRVEVVEFFFNALVSHSIDIRRISLNSVPWILALFKRKYRTVMLNTRTGIKLAEGETIRSILQYKSKPTTGKYSLEFENHNEISQDLVVHKQHLGFTSLPVQLPLKICPDDFNDLTDQSEGVKAVLQTTAKFLKDDEYLKKLLTLWGIEDKTKGAPSKRTGILKLISRNGGPEVLSHLLPFIIPMAKDKDQWKQRCVSNIISGILFGMKLWSDEKISSFWNTSLKPIVNECLNNVTQETFDYWVSAISIPSNNRDGNKIRFFIQFLQERFTNSLETAQTTSVDAHNNMTFFDLAVSNVMWRGGDLFTEIFSSISKYFLVTPIPYRNVRVQLGRLLGNVYEWDLESFNAGIDLSTPCNEFLTNVMDALKNVVEESASFQANDSESEENAEARNLLLKFKTVLEWINCACWDLEATVHSKFYCFIPWLCYFESYDPDPEVSHLASIALAGLSKHLIRPEHMDTLLDSLNMAASSPSWKARLCVLEFLKVFALCNASIIVSRDIWSNRVVNLVLGLLGERKLEVRELASRVFCGLLHCLLVPKEMDLLTKFKSEADQLKKRKLTKKGDAFGPEEVDRLHSVILGVCAFVDAHPYTCPDYLPDVLVFLTTHLHDCQPIPTTIRKCLSNWRRTHNNDNWKIKFSEDQLTIMTDIFVSPCYYA